MRRAEDSNPWLLRLTGFRDRGRTHRRRHSPAAGIRPAVIATRKVRDSNPETAHTVYALSGSAPRPAGHLPPVRPPGIEPDPAAYQTTVRTTYTRAERDVKCDNAESAGIEPARVSTRPRISNPAPYHSANPPVSCPQESNPARQLIRPERSPNAPEQVEYRRRDSNPEPPGSEPGTSTEIGLRRHGVGTGSRTRPTSVACSRATADTSPTREPDSGVAPDSRSVPGSGGHWPDGHDEQRSGSWDRTSADVIQSHVAEPTRHSGQSRAPARTRTGSSRLRGACST